MKECSCKEFNCDFLKVNLADKRVLTLINRKHVGKPINNQKKLFVGPTFSRQSFRKIERKSKEILMEIYC